MSAGTQALARARFAIGLDARQAALVAEALGGRPYVEVHALVARLQAWAAQGDGAPFVLAYAELVLVLRALGDLPYRRVHVLVGALQSQLESALALLREAA